LQERGDIEAPQYKHYKKHLLKCEDVLSFWKINRTEFPYLSEVVRVVYAFFMSAAGIEVDYSMAGLLLRSTRANLDPIVFEMLLLLKINYSALPDMHDVPEMQLKDYHAKLPDLYRGDVNEKIKLLSVNDVEKLRSGLSTIHVNATSDPDEQSEELLRLFGELTTKDASKSREEPTSDIDEYWDDEAQFHLDDFDVFTPPLSDDEVDDLDVLHGGGEKNSEE
jgi:hypothetical protein